MAYPPDPVPPERSIYERLGIDANARKLRRPVRLPGMARGRSASRSYAMGLFALLLVAGLMWAFANNGGGGPVYSPTMPDAALRRMDMQAAQISALTQRVGALEKRVQALQRQAAASDADAKAPTKKH